MERLEVVAVSDESGVILPQEVLTRLGWRLGDEVQLTETAQGAVLITRSSESTVSVTPPL